MGDAVNRNLRIVIVEDDWSQAFLIKDILRRLGQELGQSLELKHFAEGLKAADHIFSVADDERNEYSNPDLLFLDVMLPDIDSYRFLRMIKRKPETRSIPVIMMSAVSAPQAIRKCYQHGANAYILKPMDKATFKGRFQRSLHYWLDSIQLTVRNESEMITQWEEDYSVIQASGDPPVDSP